MLAKRVIPSVLVRGKTAFKGPGFGPACTRSVGSALSICRTHAMRGVDELMILDIAATAEGRGPDLDLVRELSADCFVPITVGGGVRSLRDIDALLRAGADKIAVCTGMYEVPGLLEAAAKRFGSQALVAVLDLRGRTPMKRCGTLAAEGFSALRARWLEDMGAGEVVVQFIHAEATLEGYDLDALHNVASALSIPVIASGGCAGPEDMLRAIKLGADACAAGALFQFEDTTPRDCARFLQRNGVEVRQ